MRCQKPLSPLRFRSRKPSGEVTERPKVQHWKCCVAEMSPRVRIPPSPLKLLVEKGLRQSGASPFFLPCKTHPTSCRTFGLQNGLQGGILQSSTSGSLAMSVAITPPALTRSEEHTSEL